MLLRTTGMHHQSALSKTDDPRALKAVVLKQRSFDGINGKIIFAPYGYAIRARFIQQIQDGKIRMTDRLDPQGG